MPCKTVTHSQHTNLKNGERRGMRLAESFPTRHLWAPSAKNWASCDVRGDFIWKDCNLLFRTIKKPNTWLCCLVAQASACSFGGADLGEVQSSPIAKSIYLMSSKTSQGRFGSSSCLKEWVICHIHSMHLVFCIMKIHFMGDSST